MEPLWCWDSSLLSWSSEQTCFQPASLRPVHPPAGPEWPESSQGVGGWAALIAWAGLSLFLLLFLFIWNGPWPSLPPASAHIQAPSIGSPAEGIPTCSLMDREQAAEVQVPVLPSEGRW